MSVEPPQAARGNRARSRRGGCHSRIYPELNEFPIDEIDLELCNDGYEQVEVFTESEPVPDFSPGVIDVHAAEIESVAEIKRNIKQGLKIVSPDRLTLTPDCGLKLLPRHIAHGKVENMVTAAREIEAELDTGELDPAEPTPAVH